MKDKRQAIVGSNFGPPEQAIQEITRRIMEACFQLFIACCLGGAALILVRLLWM
jgi:hypothetical protein